MRTAQRTTATLVARRQWSGLYALAVLLAVFPVGPWLLSVPPKCDAVVCVTCFDLGAVTIVSACVFAIAGFFPIAIMARLTTRADVFLCAGATWSAALGLWWFLCGAVALLCTFQGQGLITLAVLVVSTLMVISAVFWFHLRNAIPKTIALNSSAINFATMEYRALGPFVRPDRRQAITLSVLASFAAAGIPLAMLIPSGAWTQLLLIGISWFLGIAFFGYLALGNVYQAWLIHNRCRALGRVMRVWELAERPY